MQEDIQDPRPKLLSNIDFSKCRVEFSNYPIVLMCGGELAEPANHLTESPLFTSLRDAICRSGVTFRTFKPEDIKSWYADGIFKNLMIFEEELASICTLVVIVLESAGSLVELGAFSQLPYLSQKIVAVKSSKFIKPSFISHGILRYIKENNETSVRTYDWDINNPKSITSDIINDVISDITEEVDKLIKTKSLNNKTELLKKEESAHIVVLICEIVKYFKALKETEILEFLHKIEIPIKKEELKRKLFLLEEFELIKKVENSDAIFYIRSEDEYNRLRLSFKNEQYLDADRIQMQCMDFYRNDLKNHRKRIRVISQVEQGAE